MCNYSRERSANGTQKLKKRQNRRENPKTAALKKLKLSAKTEFRGESEIGRNTSIRLRYQMRCTLRGKPIISMNKQIFGKNSRNYLTHLVYEIRQT